MTGHEPDGDFIAYITGRMLWLRRVAFLLCQDWHQADDLAQTAITKLYARWPKVRSTERLDGYLRTILVNTYLSERRTPWWRRVTLHQQLIDHAAFDTDIAASVDLREALASLPPRQRAAIVLRYYCDLSVEQTAHELDCSPGTVKSQTSRGLESLRQALETTPAG
ncbi:SigE family RNA polymerase sigma factor [Streptacidiphilus sp. N1-10]|uniref:SigE family RNA polymerase sigma factor n=1 Tax=Streptacidiphilus jeojiensis TaxID=3229225 RepID=A0ABV6XHS1_9ACTN